jgi:protein-disulfide isomerase
VYGPENAKITILEFADASCGYCKRQVGQDQTVDTVMAQYPNDVNVIFKNFPIFNETAAQAMACSEDYLSPENYHQYVIAVFQADDATSVDALADLAANYGADAATIANCVNNGDKA